MLIYFTDANTNKSVAINPRRVVVVFEVEEEGKTVTIINTVTGNIAVTDSQLNVVGAINGAIL